MKETEIRSVGETFYSVSSLHLDITIAGGKAMLFYTTAGHSNAQTNCATNCY